MLNKTAGKMLTPFPNRVEALDWKMIAGVDLDRLVSGGVEECQVLQDVLPGRGPGA